MTSPIDAPLHTQVIARDALLPLSAKTVYFAGDSLENEDRTTWWRSEKQLEMDLVPCLVTSVEPTAATFNMNGSIHRVNLRGRRDLGQLLNLVDGQNVCIDITGLPLHVWAPLLRASLRVGLNTKVVYVEPGEYRFSPNPIESGIFDLSERVSGVAPIPGFACLSRMDENESIFVPILGFEGPRFAHILENVQPANHQIWPVIGVPGALIEFPFFVYLGNKRTLVETRAWANARYVRANCPFGMFMALRELASEWKGLLMKVALLGPKPQILGAILYYLACPGDVELIYDHPITRDKRTEGVSRICLYDLSQWAALVQLPGCD